MWTDTDFAGSVGSRKSTSAGLIQLAKYASKSWSTNQAVVALSPGEAEYYCLVTEASMRLASQAILERLEVQFKEAI